MKQKKMKWFLAFTTVFALACGSIAIADAENEENSGNAVLKISLSQAIDKAMANNSQIEVQQLQIDSLDVSLEEIKQKIWQLRNVDFAYQTQDYYLATEITPKKTEAAKEMAVTALAYTKNSIAYGVEAAYYGVLKAEKNLEFAKSSLERANTQLKNAQASYKAGTVAKLDVLSAESNAKSAQASVNQAENSVASAKMELNQLMGVPLSTQLVLTSSLTAKTAGNIDLNAAIDKAMTTDATVASAKLNMINGQLDFDYTAYAYASETYNYKRDEAAYKKLVLQYEEAQKTLEKNVRNAYNSLATTAENMSVLNSSLELAKESYRLSQLRYEMGMATTYDVLNAEASLKQAELGWLDAIYNNNLANAKFTYGVFSSGGM